MPKAKNQNMPIQVIDGLFDVETFKGIQAYVETVVPTLRCDIDNKTFVRKYIHNNSFFVGVHRQLADFASDAFKERVKPSYCFLSMYKDGGRCPLHIDRPQCRYTIDYLIRKTSTKPWPICISEELPSTDLLQVNDSHPTDRGKIDSIISSHTWTTVELKPNDAVLYSGTNSWHYRPTVLRGEADLVFFHFVPEGFSGTLD